MGLQELWPVKDLERLTWREVGIDCKGEFPGLSNRPAKPPNKTAAPVDAGSGGDDLEKLHSISTVGFYASLRIITTHFGIDENDLVGDMRKVER